MKYMTKNNLADLKSWLWSKNTDVDDFINLLNNREINKIESDTSMDAIIVRKIIKNKIYNKIRMMNKELRVDAQKINIGNKEFYDIDDLRDMYKDLERKIKNQERVYEHWKRNKFRDIKKGQKWDEWFWDMYRKSSELKIGNKDFNIYEQWGSDETLQILYDVLKMDYNERTQQIASSIGASKEFVQQNYTEAITRYLQGLYENEFGEDSVDNYIQSLRDRD